MENKLNTEQVLKEVNTLLDEMNSRGYRYTYRMRDVYERLSIFDWWTEELSKSRLVQMKQFLTEAHKLGFDGYCCFKVGVSGCANGMWAHKKESTDGYSPDGPCLYRSFTPDYTYWSINMDGKGFLPKEDKWDSLTTIKKLEDYIKAMEV